MGVQMLKDKQGGTPNSRQPARPGQASGPSEARQVR